MLTICPGCGLELPSPDGAMDEQYHATWACRELLSELTAYSLLLRGPEFIHQLAVDAYLAQHVGPNVKAIGTSFALITLYLMFERGFTGRQAQLAHMQLAKHWKTWPRFEPPPGSVLSAPDTPSGRGGAATARVRLTVRDVVLAPPGDARNRVLMQWGRAVWEMWRPEHAAVQALLERTLFSL